MLIVKRSIHPMVIKIANTALMNVTSMIDSEVVFVDKDQKEKELIYLGTMTIAKNLLKEGIIAENEYEQIDTKFRQKYSVSLSNLFTDISLIKFGEYGNMSH